MGKLKYIIFLLVFCLGTTNIPKNNVEVEMETKVGDVYVYRDARLVLDVSFGVIVYKQIYLYEGNWRITTNAMPYRDFTNNWKKVK